MNTPTLQSAVLAVVLLVGGCANKPTAPDWQGSAFSALNSFSTAYLEGNSRVADFEFQRAQAEVARTGRPDLMARLALVRCAVQVASLVLDPCDAFEVLAADAQPTELNYALFLSGHWASVQTDLLPAPYRDWAKPVRAAEQRPTPPDTGTPANPASASTLAQIKEPQSRLIAAAVLYKSELIRPVDIALAAETASNQGWRRPLLAWLGVLHQRAHTAGDARAAAQLQRRIDLVLQNPAR